MQKRFQEHIQSHFSEFKNQNIGVAISGGVDSVVLAYLLFQSGIKIALLHCNFNLRGDDSDGDQAYVKRLSENWDVPFITTEFNTKSYAEVRKTSIQVAARELRYAWFAKMADLHRLDVITTAHHADDNLETFLINLSRGTGLEGLTGIPKVNTIFSRPLLPFSKQSILDFAKQNKLQWREDASNNTTKYLRNHIRHKVVPNLKEIQPDLLSNFNSTLSYLKQSQQLIHTQINKDKARLFVNDEMTNGVKMSIKELQNLSYLDLFLFESLKKYGFSAWSDIKNMLGAQSGTKVLSKTHILLKDRDYLLLYADNKQIEKEIYQIKKEDEQLVTSNGRFSIAQVQNTTVISAFSICLDANKIEFPLIVRKWKEGDYFYPIGMQGKKKVSKYFKDEKVSIPEKQNIWLLESNTEILWIVGKRADRRSIAKEQTEQKIMITYYENV